MALDDHEGRGKGNRGLVGCGGAGMLIGRNDLCVWIFNIISGDMVFTFLSQCRSRSFNCLYKASSDRYSSVVF